MNRTMLMHLAATTLVAGGSLFAQSRPMPPMPATPAMPATPPDAPANASEPSPLARVAPSEAKLRATLAEVAALLDKEDLTDEERAQARKKLAQALDRLKVREGVPLVRGLFVASTDGDPVVVRGRPIDGEAPVTVVREGRLAETIAPSEVEGHEVTPADPAAPPRPPMFERHERRVAELRAKIDGIRSELDGLSAKGQTLEPLARYREASEAAEQAKAHQRKAATEFGEARKLYVRSQEAARAAELRGDIAARVRGVAPAEAPRWSLRRTREIEGRAEAEAAAAGEGELRALIDEMRAEMREIRSLVRQLRDGTEQAEAGQSRARSSWNRGSSGGGAAGSARGEPARGEGGSRARASRGGSSNRGSASGGDAGAGQGSAAGSSADDGDAVSGQQRSGMALRWGKFPGGDQPAVLPSAERLFFGRWPSSAATAAGQAADR